jgi:hypothetical protein
MSYEFLVREQPDRSSFDLTASMRSLSLRERGEKNRARSAHNQLKTKNSKLKTLPQED